MKTLDILYNFYSCYAYLLAMFLGSFIACKYIKMQHKKNIWFYLLMTLLYMYFLSHTEYRMILKFGISLICGAGFVCIYDIFSPLFSKTYKIIKKYQYFWCLMSFFSINTVLYIPDHICIWTTAWHAVNYSFGIGSRFFIGAFLHLFSPDFISAKFAFWFCTISYLTTAAIISFCLDILIKETSSSYREIVIFLILLYVSSPFCIDSYILFHNFGRLEVYTLLLMMLSVIIFFNIKNNWIKYIFITLLTCISTAIYQGYIFLYYPMIVITMIVSLLTLPTISCKDIAGPLFNIITTSLSFIYFQFFSFVKYDNLADFSIALEKMTDMYLDRIVLDYELFQSLSYAYDNIMIPSLTNHHSRELLTITLLLFLPLMILFYHIYKKAWISKKQVKWYRNEYLYCLLINFSVLPQFILNIDWGRWLIALGTMMFFEIFLLVYTKNSGIIKALSKMNPLIKKYYFSCLIIIIYFAKLQAWETTPETFYDAIKIYDMLF